MQESLKKEEACRILGSSVLEIESYKSQYEFVNALDFIGMFKENEFRLKAFQSGRN